MKHFFRLLGIFVLVLFVSGSLKSQTYPVIGSGGSQVTPGGVWSKNMELICPLSLPWNSHEMFQFQKIKYGSTLGSTGHYIITTERKANELASDPSYLRVVDVTNPRSINADAVKIRVQTATNVYADLHDVEAWTDNSTGNTFSGHTFAVVYINNIVVYHDNNEILPDINAAYLIFDLTEALTCGATTITVADPTQRVVSGTGLNSTYEKSVYLGYLRRDNKYMRKPGDGTVYGPHTTFVEKETGIFIVSPSGVSAPNYPNLDVTKTYVDLYDLRNIAINTAGTRTSTSLIDVKRIGKEWATNDIEPVIVTLPSASSSLVVVNHETTAERINDNKIRLYTSGFGKESTEAGGVCVQNVDFSDPEDVSYDGLHFWPYDIDREYPTRQTSGKAWNSNLTHTAVPVTINNTKFVLTTQELASPFFDRGSGITPTLTISGGTYVGANWPILYDGTNENDKYLGNYLRVWETDTEDGFTILKGTGTYNGPLSSYDPVEQDPNSGSLYTSAALSNSAISIISSSAANSLSSSTAVGPNTIHRVRPVAGSTDVFISAYSQGIRVVDLKNLSTSNPSVIEKAFFDYIPTLNYAKNSEYFYLNGNHDSDDPGDPSDSYSDFRDFFWPSLQSYFIGTFDVRADIERTGISGGLPTDEKFVYGMGLGEGYMSENSETLPRNWINNGGFMILRYFDDKIGGTISGYTGTSAWNNRSYRDVNLQGIFEVSRDVTVATGATVNLLKDTKLNPDASPGECLIIDGTVNVQTLAAEFTSTTGRGVIDVPVLVRNGGKLVIKSGAVIDFTKKVTVDIGGELTIESGAKVVFANPSNICNGKFLVNGTSTSRVKIHAALNTGRTSTAGNSFFTMKGNPAILSMSKLQIKFADVENVCFDATDIKPGTPEMITQSTFSAHTTSIKPYLVSYQRKSYADFFDALTPVKVTFTTFKDRNRACLDYEESHSGRYESCIDQTFTIHGLGLANVNFTEISNSHFSHLMTGAYLDKGFIMNVKTCTLSYSNRGIISVSNAPIICANTFHGVEQGFQGISTLAAFVYDNKAFKSSIAGLNISGATHFYRGNRFEDYCTGLVGWNASLQLRDHVSNDVWNKLGRNQFLTTDPALIELEDSIPSYGIYGCSVNDIHLVNSRLLIHCGFNYFSKYSALHVFTGGTGTFDPSYNQWDDVGGSIVRTDATVTGNPLNTSQTVGASCNRVDINPPCPISICTQGIYIVEYIGQDSFVRASYNGVWNNVKDSTLSLDCRKIAAHELAEMAVTLDSDLYYSNTITRLDSVYSKTSNPPILRSTALMLKGSLLERMDSSSAALYTYSNIVTNFASYPDSIPAAWRIQYLSAVIDTVNYDSLIWLYHIRVLNDTRRMTFVDDPAYKMAGQIPDHQTSEIEATISLEQNVPNPWDSHTDISFTLPVSGFTTLKVIDILGNEVKTLINGEAKAGRNVVSYKASDIPEGIYFYRLQYGNQVITKKMQKSR